MQAGGVYIQDAEVNFQNCNINDNRATGSVSWQSSNPCEFKAPMNFFETARLTSVPLLSLAGSGQLAKLEPSQVQRPADLLVRIAPLTSSSGLLPP